LIEYVFAREVREHGIAIFRNMDMDHQVFVTAYPMGGFRMSIQQGLHGVPLLEAVALQMGRIVMGHDFKRSGYKEERRDRRDWRAAEAWAAKRLIPDRCMKLARRLGQDPWDVARDIGVSERLVIVRYNIWPERRGQMLHLTTATERAAVAWARDP
jgi:hypothetical protein